MKKIVQCDIICKHLLYPLKNMTDNVKKKNLLIFGIDLGQPFDLFLSTSLV